MTSFDQQIARASVLLEALPYMQRFRGQTFVIKYGGSAMDEPELVERVLRDVVFLEVVGANPVIIHGGGKAITRRMAERGIQATFIAGLRVTCRDSVAIVDEVLNTEVSPSIVDAINRLGGQAVQVPGNRTFRAVKAPPVLHEGRPVDLGFVGVVESCDTSEVRRALAAEMVPVLSPVGVDASGQVYNINADVAAADLAVDLRADKLIYLSDVNGVLRDPADPSTRIPTVTRADAARLKAEGIVRGGMIPKIDSCLDSLARGVKKVHLIDGRIPHALLLELFTDRGIGTEIVE
ncbi:MAG: acetylglutamate kinase [Candidatus Methylacidiphilales bacterium]